MSNVTAPNIQTMIALLELDWITEDNKKIIKDNINDTIGLIPQMMEILKKSMKEWEKDE